ncbi:methyltransferase domain-containing protein [bacterium]|nr:methyltransferase domain-containing protein [bacterium]
MNALARAIASLPAGACYALFGAGRFTRRMLDDLDHGDLFADGRILTAVLDDAPPPSLAGLPCATPERALADRPIDHIILSTDAHEEAFLTRLSVPARRGLLRDAVRIVRLPMPAFEEWKIDHPPPDVAAIAAPAIDFYRALPPHGDRVLELFGGAFSPIAPALAARGANVVAAGFDVIETDPRFFSARHEHAFAHAAAFEIAPVFDRVRAARTPGRTLPFYDATFDAVLVWLDAAAARRYARELARVVRPGGRVLVIHRIFGDEAAEPLFGPDWRELDVHTLPAPAFEALARLDAFRAVHFDPPPPISLVTATSFVRNGDASA